MTSERMGEMFKGDSVDKCAGKFLLVSMGGRVDPSSVRAGEHGPPFARAKIFCIQPYFDLTRKCEDIFWVT